MPVPDVESENSSEFFPISRARNTGLSGLDSKSFEKPLKSKPKQTYRKLTLDEFELVASTGFRFAGRKGFFWEVRAAGMDLEHALELAKQARWMEDEGKATRGAGALLRAAIRGEWDYIFGYTPAEKKSGQYAITDSHNWILNRIVEKGHRPDSRWGGLSHQIRELVYGYPDNDGAVDECIRVAQQIVEGRRMEAAA